MNLTDLSTAFGMTMIAGLSTGIGSLIAFISKKNKYQIPLDSPGTVRRSDDLHIIYGTDAGICQTASILLFTETSSNTHASGFFCRNRIDSSD